jgi:DNA-binding NarL/FixJ family response regulator
MCLTSETTISFNVDVTKGIFSIIESLEIPPDLSEKNIHSFITKLPKRKVECLYYLVKGKTAKETAKLLNISHRTVEHYLEDIKNRWGCNSKSMLIDFGFQYFKKLYLYIFPQCQR